MCQKPGTSLAGNGRSEGNRPMAQLIERDATLRSEKDKAVKILAKSIFRELKTNGYEAREIVALSTELLDLLSTEFKHDSSK